MGGENVNCRNVSENSQNMQKIIISSRNVDGLRDEAKRRKLFLLLKASSSDIILLQETHCTKEFENTWKNDWDGEIIFSHGTSSQRGVAILIKRSADILPVNEIKDEHGRLIIIEIPLINHNIAIANIYGPNEDSPAFFQKLISHIDSLNSTEFIFGGDWNVTQTFELDRFGSKNDYGQKSRELIHTWMDEINLTDIWRLKNPNTKRYTLIRKRPHPHGSRLDYFIISSSLINNVTSTDIGVKILSDHAPINLEILVNKSDRGKGYFKLNTSHLKLPEYVQLINETIETNILQYEPQLDA